MKSKLCFLTSMSLLTLLLETGSARGQESPAPHPSMKEDSDGVLQEGEYEVISTNGSITRAHCPYSCEMRGLPQQFCKTWTSTREKDKCYVQDTRIPSQAINFGTP